MFYRLTQEKEKKMRNQKGFTLIEIIAVLVILGILAAVAVPKFVDMQSEAQEYAVEGALGALASTAYMNYAYKLLQSPSSTGCEGAPVNTTGVTVGDFTGNIACAGGVVTVTVTGGPDWWSTNIAKNSKSFALYE
jgi:prepilin-type N-terminal cleavage/methylation domain-containing protein